MQKSKASYDDYTSWKEFQCYFPEDFRINSEFFPKENYIVWEGKTIHLDHYMPNQDEKKIKLILVHGGGANGRLMFPIGIALMKLGYECIVPDLPGFGLSEENCPTSYSDWVDLVQHLIEVEFDKDGKKIVLCGISLGGMLCYHAACSNKKVVGMMVSSLADTSLKAVQKQLSRNFLFGPLAINLLNVFKETLDSIRIPIKYTTKMWAMANNRSFVEKLKKDKIGSGGKVYLKFLRTLMEYRPNVEPEDFKSCEILLFQPEMDYIIPWRFSAFFYNRLNCAKKVIFLEGCGHIPMEEPGINQLRNEACLFLEKIENRL